MQSIQKSPTKRDKTNTREAISRNAKTETPGPFRVAVRSFCNLTQPQGLARDLFDQIACKFWQITWPGTLPRGTRMGVGRSPNGPL